MTNQLLGATELGLVYGLMVLGVFITFRILKIPDLTVDGSVVLGMSVTAMISNLGHPFLALFAAVLAGMAAGTVTGFLQTKVKVPPILAGILTMSGLYSINLLIMKGSPNVSLLGTDTVFSLFIGATGVSKHTGNIIVGFLICALVVVIIEFFFRTHLGLCIRATGDNEEMVRATSIDTDRMKWIALAIANGCVGLSGGLAAQYLRYSDVTSGSGTIVIGFAAVIIGEAVCGRRNITVGFISTIVGSVLYRVFIALAINTDFLPNYFLKFITVMIITIALAVSPVKEAITARKNKARRLKENA
ncbi:MAG: ABC transporter permease [Eubacteriales bacterium]|nr:ABC transporter permease [Eubacteriales bacterium]